MHILVEITAVALIAILVAKCVAAPARGRILGVLKAWVSIRAFWLLLSHPFSTADGNVVAAGRLVFDALAHIDAGTFWTFVTLAAGIKFVGILASMYRWMLLLRGQAIELPFRHIFGSFLIGRFIGTLLPGSVGLDGYKLYDAARFSGKSVEVATTTVIEKVIGFSGIFISFLVALPFGIEIFGANASVVARTAIPVCLGLIGSFMLVLFYPSLTQWAIGRLPIPGKSRLTGFLTRAGGAAAAYRDKRVLVANAFALSFVAQFSTAAMFYFTALAIGAVGAEFWSIALGPSIQVFATLLSPFAIAGENLREAAQFTLLGSMIGPVNATLSAALGFFSAELLTLFGGFLWWTRRADYKPAYCLVEGRQVGREEAAEAAALLIDAGEAAGSGALLPLTTRMRLSAGRGLGAGIYSGLAIGIVEALVLAYGGIGDEAQVLWYAPLNYGALLGLIGLVVGAALAVFPMDEEEIGSWIPTLAFLTTLVPTTLAIALLRIHDFHAEQSPPPEVFAGLFGVALVLSIALYAYGPRLFSTRLGSAVRAGAALSSMLVTTGFGIVASVAVLGAPSKHGAPPMIPASLADRPNVILVVVDSLRADLLSCYGGPLSTPAICALAEEGGTIFTGFAPASGAKPATATILTSLSPSSHGAMSMTSVLPEGVTLISEMMKGSGYTTGGIVSNLSLAPNFGFDQGYDEYHYLTPDILAGAEKSSSKLALYDFIRSLYFTLNSDYRFGDYYQDSEVVNEVAFDYISRNRTSRFFLFLHYMDPHDPYFAHPYDGHAALRSDAQHADPLLAERAKRLYQGEIEYLDANFQRLLEKLHDFAIYDDTVIALVSGYGGEVAEHDHDHEQEDASLGEGQSRIALLVKWASDRVPATLGRDARDHVARLVDVVPTLAAQAGAALPDDAQGLDLALGVGPETSRSADLRRGTEVEERAPRTDGENARITPASESSLHALSTIE